MWRNFCSFLFSQNNFKISILSYLFAIEILVNPYKKKSYEIIEQTMEIYYLSNSSSIFSKDSN